MRFVGSSAGSVAAALPGDGEAGTAGDAPGVHGG